MKSVYIIALLILPFMSAAQIDSALIKKLKMLETADVLKRDTVAALNDPLDKKIELLLQEKSGSGLQSIIRIKIAEEQQKDTTHKKEYYDKLLKEITSGHTGQLINTTLINIYKRTFTPAEIDELVRFYSTSAGKKMDSEYLVLLVESAKAAEQLMKIAAQKIEPPKK